MANFIDIPVFLTVVEENSFTRAAEKLGLTNSAVSKRVSNLEKHLNVKLLIRTTRRIELTEAGERYIEYARHAHRAIEEAEYAATENENMPNGLLRVSAPVTFGNIVLANLLPAFLKKYPQLKVEVDLSDVFSKVNIENFDLMLTSAHFINSSYSATTISVSETKVIASPEFISLYGTPDTPEDLVNFNCLLPSTHQIPDQWVFAKDEDEIKVKVSGNVKINNPLAVKNLTLNSVGISCLGMNIIEEDIEKGNLVTLLNDYKIPPRTFRAIYPEKNYIPAKVKSFIDFLVDELKSKERSTKYNDPYYLHL
jgi:DNA-binding transcriptional LysR family regulator